MSMEHVYPSTFPIIPPWAIRVTQGLELESSPSVNASDRLQALRLVFSCFLTTGPCNEEPCNEETDATCQSSDFDIFVGFEEAVFMESNSMDEYRRHMKERNMQHLRYNKQNIEEKICELKIPSLCYLSFMAVWSGLTAEEQERTALAPNFILDPVRCLLTEALMKEK